jgi:hypothetical protein
VEVGRAPSPLPRAPSPLSRAVAPLPWLRELGEGDGGGRGRLFLVPVVLEEPGGWETGPRGAHRGLAGGDGG